MIAGLRHLAQNAMQGLTTPAADDDDYERAAFDFGGVRDLFQHRAPNRCLRRHHLVPEIVNGKIGEISRFGRIVREPDVSGYRSTPNNLFAGRRHFGNTNFTNEARLYHAARDYTSNISCQTGRKILD